ncbi:hypothetical protein [Arthrobacter sp. FW306-2-2C-D06B]|uniref:hypothetical protein n=1 Tax=Arthrobacter sp. FW306-2-2C-D06B TaxID=2879618 RepID=UPI001F1F26E0|nr:hypothetical protein [Arthrobacter sp. FW306-2-2C-D06B]UKA58580.1 hypothetical protein LFT47_20315 [Arthrobacter sp. FW306-2-2C-D06B]
MSEKSASCGEQGVDRLLAEAGLDEAYEIRTELLELRALASTRPQPSAAVQALMVSARVATAPVEAVEAAEAVAPFEAASAAAAAPIDELAARRRKKARLTFAAVAVAASLAAGATAAAASEGGIPGTIEHLGAVVGSVVSQLTPGSGGNAPQQQGTHPELVPMPTQGTGNPASPSPESSSPGAQNKNTRPSQHATPSTTPGSEPDARKELQDIAKGRPGPITIPTPAVPTPTLPLPQPVPSEILPGNPVKP